MAASPSAVVFRLTWPRKRYCSTSRSASPEAASVCGMAADRSESKAACAASPWSDPAICWRQPAADTTPSTSTNAATRRRESIKALFRGLDLFAHTGAVLQLLGMTIGSERIFVALERGIGIAQVLENGGIFPGFRHGALELAGRAGIVALLVEDPAQAVDEEAVIGLLHQGLAHQLFGEI